LGVDPVLGDREEGVGEVEDAHKRLGMRGQRMKSREQ
jgi:hypothetical protein